ncbi:hypothetical protein Tco_1217645 [Tanacetum coccineum]
MTSKAQQIELDNALVALENHRVIDKCNMRINPGMKQKEPTYQVALDALALTTCYPEFLITAEVPGMYYKKNLDFVALIWEDLAYQIDNMDSKKPDNMFYPRFTKIIIHHFLTKYKSISWRNKMFMHTARDDSLLGTMRFVSRHANTQVYGAILPKAMTNQALLDSVAYKTYYATALGAEPPKSRKSQKKSDSAISSEESPSKKKSAKAKKVAATKPKPTKKKAPGKADTGKGLNVLAESWGDSGEEDDDDEDDTKDESDDDGNDENDNSDDNDDNCNDERNESDRDEIPDPNKTNEEQQEDDEYDDDRIYTPPDYELHDEEKIDDE